MASERAMVRLEHWKSKLIDLSLRNKLINYRVGRASAVPVVDEVPRVVVERLLAEERSFGFLPKPEDGPALQGGDDVFIVVVPALQLTDNGLDHHSWPADQGFTAVWLQLDPVQETGDYTNLAVPARFSQIHCKVAGNLGIVLPGIEVGLEGNIRWRTAAVEDGEPVAGKALFGQAGVDYRA